MLEELSETLITRDELQGSVKEVKTMKVAELDGCVLECLRSVEATVTELSARLLNEMQGL